MSVNKSASATASPKRRRSLPARGLVAEQRTTVAADVDPDEAPELDEHFFAHAELSSGDTVIRPATDTMARRGRPPKGAAPKVQQSLRLSPEVLDWFRATGEGWQARIDEVLLAHVRSRQA